MVLSFSLGCFKIQTMNNMIAYVKKNTASFTASPFNRVDALILCWLAYYRYPDYLKGNKRVALKDLIGCGLLPDGQMYAPTFMPKKSKRLFCCLTESERFKNIELCGFCEEQDDLHEKQFAALCIKLSQSEYFIAFRGTDPSFTGWKEDFNLTYRFPIPSQLSATEYMRRIMLENPDAKFFIGGHSKGGNVAVYAAANAEENLQKAIISIYNFDGPEFNNAFYSERGYDNVRDRIIKIIPKASFVGMMFETRGGFCVIDSGSLSLLQHDPFCWTVKNGDFVDLENRTKPSVRLERAMNAWLAELTHEEKEKIIALVYDALITLDTRDFTVFFKTLYRQVPALFKAYKALSPEDKKFARKCFKRLWKLLRKRHDKSAMR